jgi:uncharacterized phage protein (TIGR02218 family)
MAAFNMAASIEETNKNARIYNIMRVISPQLEAHFAGGMTTLATCWRITRQDAVEIGFTDHDLPITFDSVLYDSIAGFTPTTVESKSNMSVDNLDVEGQVFPSKITEEDLLAGLYDYAEIEIFLVNYTDLTQGKLVVKRGRLGEVTLNSQMFQAEVRGLTQHLSQTIGQVFSPSCRAILGDSKCKVALASFTVAATVTEVTNNQTFNLMELSFMMFVRCFISINFSRYNNFERSFVVFHIMNLSTRSMGS